MLLVKEKDKQNGDKMKKVTLILTLILSSYLLFAQGAAEQDKKYGTLYYVMDPYEGWCYANSYEMKEIYPKWVEYFDFKIVPSGMHAGDGKHNASVNDTMKYRQTFMIEKASNIKFDVRYQKGVLGNEDFMIDSEIPSKVILAMQKLAPDKLFDFVGWYQTQHFFYGKALQDTATIKTAVRKFYKNTDEVLKLISSEEIEIEYQESLNFVKETESKSPSVYYEGERFNEKISWTYESASAMDNSLKMLIDRIFFYEENPDYDPNEPEGDKFRKKNK